MPITTSLKPGVQYMFVYKKFKPLTPDELVEPGTQAYMIRESSIYNYLNWLGEYPGMLRYYSREPYSYEKRVPPSELIKITFPFKTEKDSIIVENINHVIYEYYPSFYLAELRGEGLTYHFAEPTGPSEEEGEALIPQEGRKKYWWELFPWLPSLGFPKEKRMEEVITDLVIIAAAIAFIVLILLLKRRS